MCGCLISSAKRPVQSSNLRASFVNTFGGGGGVDKNAYTHGTYIIRIFTVVGISNESRECMPITIYIGTNLLDRKS